MGFYGPMGPAGFRRRGRKPGMAAGMVAGASIASRRQRRAAQASRWDGRRWQGDPEYLDREEP